MDHICGANIIVNVPIIFYSIFHFFFSLSSWAEKNVGGAENPHEETNQ